MSLSVGGGAGGGNGGVYCGGGGGARGSASAGIKEVGVDANVINSGTSSTDSFDEGAKARVQAGPDPTNLAIVAGVGADPQQGLRQPHGGARCRPGGIDE